MADPVKLNSPLIRVIRESEPDKELVLQTTNQDMVLWDRTRLKHKWPKFDEATNLWLTFLAWAAARRTGAIGLELAYEAWERDVIEALPPTDDDAESDNGAAFPEGLEGAPRGGAGPSD